MGATSIAILAVALAIHPADSRPTDSEPAHAVASILLKEFEGLLAAPQAFAATVRRECGSFPEGDLLPYVLPACAYANLAVRDPNYAPLARRRVAQLLDMARPVVERRVGKLEDLSDYRSHAVHLGQYNLALGCYRRIGGDGRYDGAHKAISDALHAALVRQQGRPLHSYPSLTWTFDTIPCLLSLRLYDLHTGTHRSDEAITRHLQWVRDRATDRATGLPFSRVFEQTGDRVVDPRGCELSWRIALVADLDPDLAKRLYASYVKAFWLERAAMAGFAEWPFGKSGRQDVDSGPIVMGIGTAATCFGIAAARAAGDMSRHDRLCQLVPATKTLLKAMVAQNPKDRARYTLNGQINPDSSYCTGFLFGDACLFYSITWCGLSRPRDAAHGR